MSRTFVLSRTDSIGDVVLTLPMAGVLRREFPDCRIVFLGRAYTAPVINLCQHVDLIEDYDEWERRSEVERIAHLKRLNADVFIHVFPKREIARLAKQAGVDIRVGTSRRWFHLFTVNRKVGVSRRRSDLHEAQLNMKLLEAIGVTVVPSLAELVAAAGIHRVPALPERLARLLSASRKNVVLHPGSGGSAVEWGVENYARLIDRLPADRCNVFVTGTAPEGAAIGNQLPFASTHVHDLRGQMTLDELIAFIASVDSLVAGSTGPLHLAAALGRQAIGLYVDRRPIHPGRWAPLGPRAIVLTSGYPVTAGGENEAMRRIMPGRVADLILGT